MSTWIFRANPKRFRIHDFLNDYGFVEYLQKDKVEEGDIVYLYITNKSKRVEYKMLVERTDIPSHKCFDDRSYSLLNKPTIINDSDMFVRFKLIERVETNELCYKKLCEHGFVGKNGRYLPMTSNRRLNNETAKYIDSFFKK